MASFAQARFEEGLQAVNRAIALDPVNCRLFYWKGQILEVQDQPEEALEAYLTFTAFNPDDSNAFVALNRADEIQKRIQSQLSDSAKHYLQGLRCLSLRQPAQALPLFERLQKMEPNNEKAALVIGQSYMAMGLPEKAIPSYQSSLRLQADNPVAYYQLGSSYDLHGDASQARAAWLKFLQFAPQSEAAMAISRRVKARRN